MSVRARAGGAHTPRGLGKVPGVKEAILKAKGISPARHMLAREVAPTLYTPCHHPAEEAAGNIPQPCSEIPSGLFRGALSAGMELRLGWWKWAMSISTTSSFPPSPSGSGDEQHHFQLSQWLSRGVSLLLPQLWVFL